jgi:RND family efflux transporter MFP subunit
MKTVFKIVIPLMIVGGALFAASRLIASSEVAEREVAPAPAPMVDVFVAKSETRAARVHGTGTVVAARQVMLAPQVGGRIIEQSDHLVLGGRFAAGETVVKIDSRDYSLAIRERRSQVEQAKLELELEKGRGRVAQRDWEVLGRGKPQPEDESSLALRKPHLETAEVALEAAKSGLQRAKLDRGRTTISAPFNATVVAESVEVGQVVQPGSSIATLVGTDEIWARVALSMENLDLIRLPGPDGELGSSVTVIQELGGGKRSLHSGRVERLVGELDPQTRLAQVIVVVENPFDPPDGQLPLLPGAFITAEIDGKQLAEVIAVPRTALVEGDRAWVVDGEGKLAKRTLSIAWKDRDHVWARSGIVDGERVVTTSVPAVEGMSVRVGDSSERSE